MVPDDRPALDRLAEQLRWKMEHLDPEDARAWTELTDREREFFRLSVKSLLDERDLVLTALSQVAPPARPDR